MAIVLEDVTYPAWANDANPSTIDIDYPATVNADDFLIVHLAVDSDNTPDWSPPDGSWIEICPFTDDGVFSSAIQAFGKIADGTETGSETFSYSGGSDSVVGGAMMRWSGVYVAGGVSSCLDATTQTAATGSSSSTPTAPSITTNTDGAVVIWLMTADDNDSPNDDTGCPGTAIYNRDTTTGFDLTMAAGYSTISPAGSSGTGQFTLDSAEGAAMCAIALKPDPGGLIIVPPIAGFSLSPSSPDTVQGAIRLEGSSGATFQTDASLDFVISYDQDPAEDEFLLAFVADDDDNDGEGGSLAFSAPTGWEEITSIAYSIIVGFQVFGKIADGTETGSETFTFSSSNASVFGGAILRFSGVDVSGGTVSSCLDATPVTNTSGTTNTPTCPSITTNTDDAAVVYFYAADDDDSPNDDSGPYRTIFNRDTALGDLLSIGATWKTIGTAGASGTAEFSLDAFEEVAVASIALKPSNPAIIYVDETTLNFLGGIPVIDASDGIPVDVTSILFDYSFNAAAPAIAGGGSALPDTFTHNLTVNTPTIQSGSSILPSTSQFILNGLSPSPASGITINALLEQLNFTGFAPDTRTGVTVASAVFPFSLNGNVSSISSGTSVEPTAYQFLFNRIAPSLGSGTSVEPATYPFNLETVIPLIESGVTVLPNYYLFNLEEIPPQLQTGTTILPNRKLFIFEGGIPSLGSGSIIRPNVFPFEFISNAPGVNSGVNIASEVFEYALQKDSPAVGIGKTVTVDLFNYLFTGFSNSIYTGATVLSSAFNFNLDSDVPAVAGGVYIESIIKSFSLLRGTPFFSNSVVVGPNIKEFRLFGGIPLIQSGVNISSVLVEMLLAGNIPSLGSGGSISPASYEFNFNSLDPDASSGGAVVVDVTNFDFTGNNPIIKSGVAVITPEKTFYFNGLSPTTFGEDAVTVTIPVYEFTFIGNVTGISAFSLYSRPRLITIKARKGSINVAGMSNTTNASEESRIMQIGNRKKII